MVRLVVEDEARRDVGEVHREQRRREVDRDALFEALHRRRRPPEVHLESGIEQRAEEPEALQVIEVQVRQHDVQLAIVAVHAHTERTHPGARVEHDPVAAVEPHLDAARVAAVAHGVGARCRQS